jgi:porphobilinogen synthase
LPLFPAARPRRLRKTSALRALVRETRLSPADFVYPLFVREGEGIKTAISSMPGVFNLSIDNLVEECGQLVSLGIPSIILFGIPGQKDARGSDAQSAQGIVQRAIRAVKRAHPSLVVMADVCLCEYTDHGHCGLLDGGGHVQNDESLPLLAKMSTTCAEAGADVIAPSDMMDGRVGAIRKALDESGFSETPILSYAAKYASAFYGPFREAAQSTPQTGDRKGYQMDPGNVREALREVALDLEEGADMVMVKPALAYLDVIRAVKEHTDVPVAAYNVSGEYAMVKAAAQNGWIDHDRAMLECLTSIKRAGADLILTYFAKDAAKLCG